MAKGVLITGASGGIGQACAHWFAERGWQVFLQGRDETRLISLHDELKAKYQIDCYYYCAELTDSTSIKPLMQKVNKSLSPLTCLIHCAGSLTQGSLTTLRASDIDQQFNLHLKSSLLLAQLSSRLMLRNKQSSNECAMVFVSSVVADQGAIGQILYSAAKSGLHGMVKSMSKELGVHNIRVNAVAPGFIDTDLVASYTLEQRETLVQATSLKRLGCSNDVAKAIGFLASEQASYITGHILAVDAGLTL